MNFRKTGLVIGMAFLWSSTSILAQQPIEECPDSSAKKGGVVGICEGLGNGVLHGGLGPVLASIFALLRAGEVVIDESGALVVETSKTAHKLALEGRIAYLLGLVGGGLCSVAATYAILQHVLRANYGVSIPGTLVSAAIVGQGIKGALQAQPDQGKKGSL